MQNGYQLEDESGERLIGVHHNVLCFKDDVIHFLYHISQVMILLLQLLNLLSHSGESLLFDCA